MPAGQYRLLTRHFFRGYFENDLLTPDQGLAAALAPLLAAIAAPGLLLPMVWSFSYGWPYKRMEEFQALVVRHEVLLVMAPMIVVALVTILQGDSLYPDRRDAEVLGRLPVPLSTVFWAKVSALLLFVSLFAVVSNGFASILYPAVANMRPQPGAPGAPITFVAHVVATFGGAAFSALGVLALLGILHVALPSRVLRVVSPLVQLVSVLLLVLAFLMLPFLMVAVDPHGQGRLSELVALHRLYREPGGTAFDWNDPPPASSFERDPLHGGMRLRDESNPVEADRLVEAFPDEPLRNALTATPTSAGEAAPWLFWCPPVWFLGWYEVLADRGGPATRLLAGRAQAGLGTAAFVAAVCYLLAYRRHTAGAMVGALGVRSRTGLTGRAAPVIRRAVMPQSVARAYLSFILYTTVRSAKHRLIIAGVIGAGLAFVLAETAIGVQVWQAGRPGPAILSIQFVLAIFLLTGLRFAFAVPSVLPASWSFRLHGPETSSECRAGTRRAVVAYGLVPLLCLLAPLHVHLFGWRIAAVHGLFGLLSSLTLLEILLTGFPKVPYASAYVPGRSRINSRLTFYVFGFQFFGYLLAQIESVALSNAWGTSILVVLAAGAYRWAVCRRRARADEERLVYEEGPPDAIQTLDLAGPVATNRA